MFDAPEHKMALDLNKLSIQQLKVELTQKGLETTGKKSELVERLKHAIENTAGDDEEEEDQEMDEDAKDTAWTPKRWLHITGGKKHGNKFKHLEVIQKMSVKRRKRDIQAAVIEHRVRLFPMEPDDMSDPEIISIMKKCSSSSLSFVTVTPEEGDKELMGLLILNFAKKRDAISSMESLKNFKEGLRIHHPSLGEDFAKFQNDWNMAHKGAGESADNFLLLLPRIPECMTEKDVWSLLPSAREIYICPKRSAIPVTYAGQIEKQDQPAYAYVQYPNHDVCKKDMEDSMHIQPTDDMRKMCLIPVSKMTDVDKDEKEMNATSHASKPTAPASKSKTAAMQAVNKAKKTLGFVSTPKGVQSRNTNIVNRARQNRPAPGQRSAYGAPNNDYPRQNMPQRGIMGPGPRSAPPFGAVINQLENVAAMRGPEEAQGIRMLSEIMSNMGNDRSPAMDDVISHMMRPEQQRSPQHPPQRPQQNNQSFNNQRAYNNQQGRFDNQQRRHNEPQGYNNQQRFNPQQMFNQAQARRVAAAGRLNDKRMRPENFQQGQGQSYAGRGGGGFVPDDDYEAYGDMPAMRMPISQNQGGFGRGRGRLNPNQQMFQEDFSYGGDGYSQGGYY